MQDKKQNFFLHLNRYFYPIFRITSKTNEEKTKINSNLKVNTMTKKREKMQEKET